MESLGSMSVWSAEWLEAAVSQQGLAAAWLARPARVGTGIATDSRTIQPGQWFVALKGETHDGHEHLAQAIAAGAAGVVVHDRGAWERVQGVGVGVGALLVRETGQALLALASAYRRQVLGKAVVIGVAGSNGKTTTVRLVTAALSRSGRRVHASPKSFNNAVGVPLTLLGAGEGHDVVVCELGTNAPGELAPLARVVQPDVLILTSLGREHLEGFGTLEGVAAEEASAVAGVVAGGVVVMPAEAPLLREHVERVRREHGEGGSIRVQCFGREEGAEVRIVGVEQSLERGLMVMLRGPGEREVRAEVPIVGEHNAGNVAGAVMAARQAGASDEAIAAGLRAELEPAPMRMERVEVRGVRVLNDAYNANPESMLAALRTFDALVRGQSPERRVLVLGDMLELGASTPAAHAEIVRRAFSGGVGDGMAMPPPDLIVFAGPHLCAAAEAEGCVRFGMEVEMVAAWDDRAAAKVAGMLRAGDWVLLKGSRGMRMERVVAALRGTGGMVEGKPMGTTAGMAPPAGP